VVFLGESLSVTQLAGSAVIVCALILLQRVHARH
jgi:drug/metabolite transporter (DMT)-like permease